MNCSLYIKAAVHVKPLYKVWKQGVLVDPPILPITIPDTLPTALRVLHIVIEYPYQTYQNDLLKPPTSSPMFAKQFHFSTSNLIPKLLKVQLYNLKLPKPEYQHRILR